MKKAGLLNKIEPAVWKQQWVIDSQAVGQGQNSLRYLSRYVFRVAISNNRIKSIENDVIKFVYKDREKKKWKIMALDAMEFILKILAACSSQRVYENQALWISQPQQCVAH